MPQVRAVNTRVMIYDIIKTYGKGKGEDTMWRSVKALSKTLEDNLTSDEYCKIERDIYASMVGGHYNEEYAHCDVRKMYYVNRNGMKMSAPYWTDEQVAEVYSKVKNEIPGAYNMWDFYVTLNMTKSDNCNLFMRWWQGSSDAEREQRVIEMAVNWLCDEDNPYGEEKIWRYLNG